MHSRLRALAITFLVILSKDAIAQQSPNFGTGFYHSTEALKFAQGMVRGLTFRQQLAQTLMVPAWSRELRADEMLDSQQFQKRLLYQIRDCGVGGVIFFQGSPLNQVYLSNYFQQESNIPLLIGIDGEWGPAMRLSSMGKYPFQMTLGATYNTDLAYQTGVSMGAQCKRLGIHFNFTPSVDVNSEPNNPIIGFRSFGSDPHNVSMMSAALSRGMQSQGVLASAKHFPGHGDTKTDSHKDLPVVEKSLQDLLKEDIVPFQHLISERVASIMVAHLKVLAIDSTNPLPSSISRKYVAQWLRKDLGYGGLIITDALNMKGVAKMASAADVALLALKAGNDIILFPEDVVGFLDSAEKSRTRGEIDSAEISERVIRLIATKYDLGLFTHRFVDPLNLESDLTEIKNKYNRLYAQQVYDEAMVFCRFGDSNTHENQLIETNPSAVVSQHPAQDFLSAGNHNDTLFVLVIGDSIPRSLHPWISQYRQGWIGMQQLPWSSDSLRIDTTLQEFGHHPLLILGMDWPTWGVKSRQIPKPWTRSICSVHDNQRQGMYIHFGHQYGIQSLGQAGCSTPIILAHEWNVYSLRAALRMAFGLAHHYSINNMTLPGATVIRKSTELDYTHGQIQGYDPELSAVLDSLMREGLAREIFPSAQLVVLRNGLIAANLQVGSVTDHWGNAIPAHQDHVYDLASITKIAATTLAFMKIYETTKGLYLDHSLSQHWKDPGIQNSPIGKITFRELLTHQSGLPAFLPLQKMAIQRGAKSFPCGGDAATLTVGEGDHSHHIALSEGICLDKQWSDSAWRWMSTTTPSLDKSYVYSDINMIILGKWIEYKTGLTLNEYVENQFYRPLGLKNTSFSPLSHGIPAARIAPTLIDTLWPRGEVRGIVHDPSAMLMGGISGNAGLFSNALDLARLMYMLEERGYAGENIGYLLKPSTVDLFTRINNPKGKTGYRGLGFDKPNGKTANKANVFEGAPFSLFGHSGYTGTWAWSDPANGITFVFLSNRTYPSEWNKKISQQGFRGQLLQTIYERLESVK
jgi:beta-glucosidase-like glycosyl hydrolase/CubicO group peptidase (beta-lactamase class C family)